MFWKKNYIFYSMKRSLQSLFPVVTIFVGFFLFLSVNAQTGVSGIYSTSTSSNVDPLNIGQYWVQYGAVDNAGNASSAVTDVYVQDTTPPNATWITEIIVERQGTNVWPICGSYAVGACGSINSWDAFARSYITASDQYDSAHGMANATITVSFDPLPIGNYPTTLATVTVSYRISDSVGNAATKTAIIYVRDTNPPAVSSVTYTSGSEKEVPSLQNWHNTNATVKVKTSEPVWVVSLDEVDTGSCLLSSGNGTQQLIYTCSSNNYATLTVKDISDLTTQTTLTVNKIDKTAPVLTTNPVQTTLEASYGQSFTVPGSDTSCADPVNGAGSGNSDLGLVSGCKQKGHSPTSISLSATGTTVVTWYATDTANNAANPVTINYTVVDTTKPTAIINPDSITISAATSSAAVKYSGGNDARLLWGTNGDNDTGGLTIQDNLDNYGSQVVINSSNYQAQNVSYSWASPFNETVVGNYIITYTIADKAGNSTTTQRTIIVQDLDVSNPSVDIVYTPNKTATNANVLVTLNFSKVVTNIKIANGSDISGSTEDPIDGWTCSGGVGVYRGQCQKTFTANTVPAGLSVTFVDNAGRPQNTIKNILIDWVDKVNPSISLSTSTLLVEAATAFTIPDGAITSTAEGSNPVGSGPTLGTGQSVTLTVLDNQDTNENSSYNSVLAGIINNAIPSYNQSGTTLTNIVNGTTYAVNYNATDSAGNTSATSTLSVRVIDTTAPVYSPINPATLTVERLSATELNDAYFLQGITALDSNDGNKTSQITVQSIYDTVAQSAVVSILNTNATGTYLVIFTVADNAGNIATTSRHVEIKDSTAPDLSSKSYSNGNTVETTWVNTDVTVTINTTEPVATPTAWTRVDDDTFIKIFSANVTNEVVTLVDYDGNSKDITISVTKIDKKAPTLALIGGDGPNNHEAGYVYYDAGFSAIDETSVSPSYGASGVYSTTTVSNNVDIYTPGTYEIIYSATDVASNTSQITRTVVVVDTTNPVITVAPDHYTLNRNDAAISASALNSYLWGGVSLSDNATPTSIATSSAYQNGSLIHTSNFTVNSINATGTYYSTYQYTDLSGNVGFATRTFYVDDTDIPTAIVTYTATSTGGANVGQKVTDTTAYSEVPWTNQYVTAKLTTSEKINTPSSWSCGHTETYTVCTKDFYGNELGVVGFEDYGGMLGSTTYTIAKIDKTPPYIQGGYNPTQTHEAPNTLFATQTPIWIDAGDSNDYNNNTSTTTQATSSDGFTLYGAGSGYYDSDNYYISASSSQSVDWNLYTASSYPLNEYDYIYESSNSGNEYFQTVSSSTPYWMLIATDGSTYSTSTGYYSP